jgi:hypothetical protein
VTDQELLDDLQRLVIEPPDLGVTWPSGLWTAAEVLGYLNQRQDRWLKETLGIVSWLAQPVVVATPEQPLPGTWLATRVLLFDTGSQSHPLLRYSRTEADRMQQDWRLTPGIPSGYVEQELATKQVSLVPAPLVSGLLLLFAALSGNPMDGTGIQLTMPDDFSPYLLYGVLADMFGKQGRAYDETVCTYCTERWDEGVELARALLDAVEVS